MRPPIRRSPEELEWEILAYLERTPTAMTTLEGIATWWLMEQRIIQTNEEVQEALNMLVEQGFVLILKGPDGQLLYRINPKKKEEARAALNKASLENQTSSRVEKEGKK